MISDKYKCIYVHITKCAGTSIDRILLGKEFRSWDRTRKIHKQHASASQIKKYYTNEEQWNNYFKFTIVRNPFDRNVSAYNAVCKKQYCLKPSNFRDKLLFKEFVYRRGIFKDLLNPYLITHKNSQALHFKTYNYYLFENNKLLVDYVGKFENLAKEWDTICEKLKINLTLSHLNKSPKTKNKHYREYYNNETKDIISKIFKKDLETFRYEF